MNNPAVDKSAKSVMLSLLKAAQMVEERLEEALAGIDLSLARYGVLEQLAQAGEPLPLSQLATRVRCVRSNMTQLVDRLEADGLVRRINDPDDRRRVRAELTAVGRGREAEGAALLRAIQAEIDTALPETDRAALARAIASL